MEIGRNDWNSKLINFFFAKPRLVILLLVGITIGGLFALYSLEREGFPQVPIKVVGVTTIYPGASPTEVESQVTKVIEGSVSDADNVKEVSSTSTNSFSSVVVTLDQDADLDIALQNIRSSIASVESQLPDSVESPTVQTFSASGEDFIIGVVGDKTLAELNKNADTLVNELSQVSGVREVKELEELKDKLLISYDNNKLVANKISVAQIEQIIQGSNIDFPIGSFDIDNKSQTLVVNGSYDSKADLENQIIGVSPQGLPLKVADIATVTVSTDGGDVIRRVGVTNDGLLTAQPGLTLGISKTENADVIALRESIDEKIKELTQEKMLDPEIEVVFLSDQSQSTKEQIDEIISGAIGDSSTFYLLGGIQLVILFMLLFVNWRAALVAATAIPISFLFTLLVVYLTGTNLNTLVLFSLVLVLGLIVDPAIVMVESIQRYYDLGATGKEAVFATGKRYGAGLFIAVLTSVIVFVPFAIVSGVFGEIIKYIPLTVVPALVASYLVPVAFIPLFSTKLLRAKKDAQRKDEDQDIWPAARVMMRFNAWILARNWRKILLLVIVSGLIFASSLLVVNGKIPVVQFSSPEDNPYLMTTTTFPKGSTSAQRDEIGKQVENVLNGEGGIENYFYQSQNRDQAIIFVTLDDVDSRSEGDSSKRIVERLETGMAKIPSAQVSVSELSVGPPAQEYQIQVQLFAGDLSTLEKAAKDVGAYLSNKDEVEKVDDGFTGKSEPQIVVVFDKTKLAASGLSVFEASASLKQQLENKQISKLTDPKTDQTLEIFLAPKEESLPATLAAVQGLKITGRTGQVVTLSSVATITPTSTLDRIERFEGKRYVNVKAKLKDSNDLVAVQTDLNNYLNDKKLEELGVDSVGNRGELDDIQQSFEELFLALIAAIFLTYLVLVLQFNSFSQPMIMLFTIPLSLIGVLPALYLAGGQLGFLEILGLTILVGIVENVAIFLIDYANQLVREKGLSLKDAIVLSSGVRFRPIILTKLVAIGGLLPLALFSPFWRGLSAVLIGGILVSGFLSMTVIPVFYTWFGAVRAKVHKKVS